MYYGMGQGGRDLTLAFASMSWKREGTQIERRAATRAAPTVVRPTRSMTGNGNAADAGIGH